MCFTFIYDVNACDRKMVEKRVVRVRVGENVSKLKNEGLPTDFGSWRKYGQKPIKGSPYPRYPLSIYIQFSTRYHDDNYFFFIFFYNSK